MKIHLGILEKQQILLWTHRQIHASVFHKLLKFSLAPPPKKNLMLALPLLLLINNRKLYIYIHSCSPTHLFWNSINHTKLMNFVCVCVLLLFFFFFVICFWSSIMKIKALVQMLFVSSGKERKKEKLLCFESIYSAPLLFVKPETQISKQSADGICINPGTDHMYVRHLH